MADGEMLSQWGLFCAETYENKPYYFPSVEAGKFYERKDMFRCFALHFDIM